MSLHILVVYDRADLRRNRFFASALRESAEARGLSAQILTSEELRRSSLPSNYRTSTTLRRPSVVLSRSRDLELRRSLESRGIPVVSPSEILAVANDKVETERFARTVGVPALPIASNLNPAEPPMAYPFILKDRFGHGGTSVRLIKTAEDYHTTLTGLPTIAWVAQPYLPTATLEARVYILGRSRPWTIEKISHDGLRSNLSFGATTRLSSLDNNAAHVVEACRSQLPDGFYGIDIVWDQDKRPLLHEIEDPVGTRALYQHGIDAARAVIDYISEIHYLS